MTGARRDHGRQPRSGRQQFAADHARRHRGAARRARSGRARAAPRLRSRAVQRAGEGPAAAAHAARRPQGAQRRGQRAGAGRPSPTKAVCWNRRSTTSRPNWNCGANWPANSPMAIIQRHGTRSRRLARRLPGRHRRAIGSTPSSSRRPPAIRHDGSGCGRGCSTGVSALRCCGCIAAGRVVAVAVNLVGIHLVGGVGRLESLAATSMPAHFLVWRLCLYGATAYGWWWMRRRLREREPHPARRISACCARRSRAVAAVVLLEISALLRQP